MKRLIRRSLGWLLALTMLLSPAPPAALAAEAGAEDTPEAVSTPEQTAAELPDEEPAEEPEVPTEIPAAETGPEPALLDEGQMFTYGTLMPTPFSVTIPVTFQLSGISVWELGIEYECYTGDFPEGTRKTVFESWNGNNPPWESVTHEFVIETLPGVNYQYQAYIILCNPDGAPGKTVYGNLLQSGVSDVKSTVLQLDVPAELSWSEENSEDQCVIFTPPESGTYQVTVNGGGALQIWDADTERWCSTNGQSLNMPGGTEQHLRVSKYGAACSVTVSKCQEGTEFGLSAQVQEQFSPTVACLNVSGTAPFRSSFIWEVEYDAGTEVCQNGRLLPPRDYSNYTGETFGEPVFIPVFPGRSYWYRVTLIPLGADGSPDGAAVFREGTFEAEGAEITPLTVGVEHSFSSNSSGGTQQDFVFKFQAETEGYYQINAVRKSVWDETGQEESPAWIELWNEEMSQWEPNQEYLHPSGGEVRYLHLPAYGDADYAIQVTKVEQTVTEPAVEIGTVTAGGFFLQIPVAFSLPFRTSANIRVDFREKNNGSSSVSDWDYLDSGNAEGVFPLSFEFETQLNTEYEYRVSMTVYGDNGEIVCTEEGDWISVNSGTPGNLLSMSMDDPTPVAFSDDGPLSVYGWVTPQKSGLYTASVEWENTESFSAYVYTYHAYEYDPGNGNWQWDSLAEPVYMRAGERYYVKIDSPEPRTVSVTFSALTPTPLTPGETLTGNCAAFQESYFSFEAADEDYYKIEITAADESWWNLTFWNEISGEWESAAAQGPNAWVIHCPAGSVRYLRLFGGGGSYQITVDVLRSDVSDFSLKVDSGRANAAGLYVEIPYTVLAPLYSSFSIDILYRDQNGGPQYRRYSRMDQYLGDTLEAAAHIETKPETWYTCQLVLREQSGSGRSVSSEEFYVYSGEPVNGIHDLSSLADGTGYALTLNGGSGGTDWNADPEWCLRFTPPQSGWYQLGMESASYSSCLYLWNEVGGHWEPAENGQKLLFLEGGIPYYLKLWMDNYDGASCTVTASPYSSQVTGFSIKTPETGWTQQDNAFSMRIPASISMPLGSSFRYGIEYSETGQGTPWRVEWEEQNYPGESLTVDLPMVVRPGMSYQIRAFVTEIRGDGRDGGTKYSESFTAKAAELTPVILKTGRNEMPAPTAAIPAQLLRFTAEKEGWYHIWSEPDYFMLPWNETEGRWGNDNKGSGTAADNVSSLFYLKAGQTLELRMDSSESRAVTVEEYTPSVTSFGIKAEEPQTVDGFLTELTFTVAAPLGSSFRAYVEYKAGETVERAFVREVTGSASESMMSWVRLDTMPDTAYQYRVCLTDPESGRELLADEWRSFQSSADASAVKEICEGARETLFRDSYSRSDEVIFRFTPQDSGNYWLILTGVNRGRLGIWDPTDKRWTYRYFPEVESQMLFLTEGTTRYFRLSMWDTEFCQVEISRYQTTVTEFTPPGVKAGTDKSGLLSFVVSAQAPICSGQISLGVLWGTNKEDLKDSITRTFSDAATEYLEAEFTVPVVPGMTYHYQAYVKNHGEEKLYATEVQSIEVPAASGGDGEPQELTPETPREIPLNAGETAVYTFTAKKAGYYTFTAEKAAYYVLYEYHTGSSSSGVSRDRVTLLDGSDGSQLASFFVGESEELTVYLNEDQQIYLVYEAAQAGTCLLEIVSKPLAVAWDDQERTKVRAELSAQTAGQYFFAVYDSEDKLLSVKLPKASEAEETLVAEFAGVSRAAYVKAFVVDSGYCPLAAAETEWLAS